MKNVLEIFILKSVINVVVSKAMIPANVEPDWYEFIPIPA